MLYLLKKITTLLITLLFISAITFVAFDVIPGDAAISSMGTEATKEEVDKKREEMGLNDPIHIRYLRWVGNAVRGDFGNSYQYHQSVSSLIGDRALTTVLLAVISFIFIYAVGVPLGILSARFAGKWQAGAIHSVSLVFMAIPTFFMGLILTFLFSVVFKVFSTGDFVFPTKNFFGAVKYLILPAIAIALPKIAMIVRYLKNSILGEENKDYVKTALCAGADMKTVRKRHVLKNALIPVITFSTMMIGEILAGSFVVEQVFSVQGVGRLLINAISMRDYPVISALIIYIATIVIVVNMLGDFCYHFADPRMRDEI